MVRKPYYCTFGVYFFFRKRNKVTQYTLPQELERGIRIARPRNLALLTKSKLTWRKLINGPEC